jgi:hypothetical protein
VRPAHWLESARADTRAGSEASPLRAQALTRHLIHGSPEDGDCERPARANGRAPRPTHPFCVFEHPGGNRVRAAEVLYEAIREVIAKLIANRRDHMAARLALLRLRIPSVVGTTIYPDAETAI